MDNEFNPNPYESLKVKYDALQKLRNDIEAQILQWHDEFLKVFRPDQDQFEKLKYEAKELKLKKASPAELDKIYDKMAMIYKRWLPIEHELHEMNPADRSIFKGLKFLLQQKNEC